MAARIVLEAKRMLAHTGLPVGTIAQTLGFEETTHFSKFFKRVADLTLGEFRLKQTES
ncbi:MULTISPECIES: helix-turn-helix domain-containing protein [Enterobacteriaceae]|uniref:helix-turn-helix domain-containing protein n=1 Tax=Enterobacteriaceae TaxID=543 RepID=UPI001586F849|nr:MULTISPECIES: helix-turn-helix domain-containing protein [Klebsiella]EKE6959348.1 helix-turn-helix domain-containing protein [Escherichia coli]MCC4981982.1 helix-turn-helix domain-containing protein [Klebsiella pneumoniae]MDV1508825.1 helix-turn-helix domain-containing protein [Klebsiella quasipneumoniae subsp. quasipneumoniae]MDV1583341.1 helix-turn-helix domain-containing protein [Klebsiella quasipneumoniae subsp. quasipneumoniae]UDD09813.1 helix-turn-helix domain-containing protein [Kleb